MVQHSQIIEDQNNEIQIINEILNKQMLVVEERESEIVQSQMMIAEMKKEMEDIIQVEKMNREKSEAIRETLWHIMHNNKR